MGNIRHAMVLACAISYVIYDQFQKKSFSYGPDKYTMEASALKYYETFNLHDLDGLKVFFRDTSELQDKPNGHVRGFEAVMKAHEDVLKANPHIHFDVKTVHLSSETSAVVCEL